VRRDDPKRWSSTPPSGSCAATGKKSYLSRRDAKKVAKRVYPGGEHMSSYRCSECGFWHNGRMPKLVRDGRVDRSLLSPRPKEIE
jgi:hypothetical protein